MATAAVSPTASPSSGQTLSPAAVQAIAASGGAPDRSSLGPRGGGGGGSDDGYDNDYPGADSGESDPVGGGSDPYGNDEAGTSSPGGYEEDPTADLPAGFLDPPRDDDDAGGSYMSGVDYHAALEGLGDWKSDLANFGKQAGGAVAKQALTAIGNKLTGGAKIPPPPAPGISTGAKIAIGAAIALPVGYLLLRGRRSSSVPA